MANELVSGLNKAIMGGSPLALSLVKTCLSTPVLINKTPGQGAMGDIYLYCETNQKSASAEVSVSLIISTDSKQNYRKMTNRSSTTTPSLMKRYSTPPLLKASIIPYLSVLLMKSSPPTVN